MAPQGFGFEPRKGERRNRRERRLVGMDRRAGRERRGRDRRQQIVAVAVDRRLNADRRATARRNSRRRTGARRHIADRRNPVFNAADGLRITQQEFRFRPS